MSERSANQNPSPAPRISAPAIQIHPRGPIDPIDSIRLALGIGAHADPIVAITRLRAANERLRALINAEDAAAASRANPERDTHAHGKLVFDAYLARCVVDEAGDLRSAREGGGA